MLLPSKPNEEELGKNVFMLSCCDEINLDHITRRPCDQNATSRGNLAMQLFIKIFSRHICVLCYDGSVASICYRPSRFEPQPSTFLVCKRVVQLTYCC